MCTPAYIDSFKCVIRIGVEPVWKYKVWWGFEDGSGTGPRKTPLESTCITGEVIHRHKSFEYVSTTTSAFPLPQNFSALLAYEELQINQYHIINIQRSATRTILPDISYEERLEILCLPTVYNFIFEIAKTHFTRIADNPEHPLFSQVIKNFSRTSSRNNTIFRPKKCRTQKRSKSFFPFSCLISITYTLS